MNAENMVDSHFYVFLLNSRIIHSLDFNISGLKQIIDESAAQTFIAHNLHLRKNDMGRHLAVYLLAYP